MKVFFIQEKGEYGGLAVAADSKEEALEIAKYDIMDMFDITDLSEIQLEIEEMRGINTDGLKKGVIECLEGLARGIYSECQDCCPICGEYDDIYKETIDGVDVIACMDCINKITKIKDVCGSVDNAIKAYKILLGRGDKSDN